MLRVLLLGEPGTRSDSLGCLLQDAGHSVETLPASRLVHLEAWVTATRPNVVLVDYTDPLRDSVEQLCYAPFGLDTPLLLLGQGLDPGLSQRVSRAGFAVYTGFGSDVAHLAALLPVLDVLVSRERTLRDEVDSLRQALSDRRDIERAKDWLSDSRKCSSQAAFEALRQKAMERGESLGHVARLLLAKAGDVSPG
jgi:response regulator NasT